MDPGNRRWIPGLMLTALAGLLLLGLAAREPQPVNVIRGQTASAALDIEAHGDAAADSLDAAPATVDDVALAVNVKAALIAAPGVNATTIDVNASGGVVTLNGTAKSSTRRDLAGYVALRVTGVNSVRNRILVISSS